MTLPELKAKVENEREHLKKSKGSIVSFTESGPTSMALIDALVAMLETQQGQIETLEKNLARHDHHRKA